MAISQRLVDPYREIRVPTSYSWQESYQAALLETDWTKIQQRVQTAESEIHKRRLELSQDHGGTQEEREALVNAMNGLRVLRTDAACMVAAARSRRSGYTPRCKLGVRSRFEVGLISLRQLATIINQCCLSWAPFLQRSYK